MIKITYFNSFLLICLIALSAKSVYEFIRIRTSIETHLPYLYKLAYIQPSSDSQKIIQGDKTRLEPLAPIKYDTSIEDVEIITPGMEIETERKLLFR